MWIFRLGDALVIFLAKNLSEAVMGFQGWGVRNGVAPLTGNHIGLTGE